MNFDHASSLLLIIAFGICVGGLLVGNVVMLFLHIKTRNKLHLATFFLGSALMMFVIGEISVLLSSEMKDVLLGRQIHRFEALVSVLILLIGAYFISQLVESTSVIKKINLLFLVAAKALFVIIVIVAFAWPELYVSQTSALQNNINMGFRAFRGHVGYAYYARDIFGTVFMFYALVVIVIDLVFKKPPRQQKWFLLGTVVIIVTVCFSLYKMYFVAFRDHDTPGFMAVAVGAVVFISGCVIGVLQSHLEHQKEVERTYRMNAIGVFAGGIAHDFRNILSGITGCTSLIKRQVNDREKVLKFTTMIDLASDRAIAMVEQLSLLSKEGIAVKDTTSIKELIQQITDFIATSTESDKGNSNVEINTHLSDDLFDANINGAHVSQVIQNLVINAIQAMPDGGKVKVTAKNDSAKIWRLHPKRKNDRFVRITVADTGKGIPEDQTGRVFEPYYTTKKEGTGLGLAVARSVIARNGGYIYLKSKENQGSNFDVYLPACCPQKK